MIVEKNVREFLTKCSNGIGSYESDIFDVDLWLYFHEDNCPIKSPIEQILYCALKTIVRFNFLDNIKILPQHKIEKYRCDFLIIYKTSKIKNELIVECDSQKFHDRTEIERRYEKARDRFFISKGYKTFHYTGTEIIKESFDKAIEIIAHITEIPLETLKDSYINFID